MDQDRGSVVNLRWQRQGECLLLKGALDRSTLTDFWSVRESQLQGISELELSGLEYIDTYGLALLLDLVLERTTCSSSALKLRGISPRLRTLIQLYNLSALISDGI